MTRAQTLSVALSLGFFVSACSVDAESGEQTTQGEGNEYSGDGVDDGFDDGFGAGEDGAGEGGGEDDGTGTGPDAMDDNVQPTYPTQHPRIYLGAHKARLQAALSANSGAAQRFKSVVDSWVGGANHWGFQAWNGALMGQLTGEANYCAKAVAVADAQVSAAEAKASSGQRPDVALNSYLHIGEMVGDVALVYDWCFDTVNPAQRTRWINYMNQAVSNVWDHTGAKWGSTPQPWLGWAVNNPANNYYYSFLRATMLVGLATKGENPKADEFIAKFRDQKFYGQLVPKFEADLVGGGSREGTGYGLALRSLFEIYDFWKATTGESLATKTRHARQSLGAFMHQTMPTANRVAPYGDQARDMTAAFFDYHRHYLQTLIALYPGEPLAARAKQLLASSNVQEMGQHFMKVYDFMYEHADINAMPLEGMSTSYYAKGIGEVYARSGWDSDATWVSIKAGAYTEDHAHQDQGSIMIYKGGWLAYDGVIDSKNGLPQGTNAHGLVAIKSGGQPVKQLYPTVSKIEALARGDGWVYTATDVTASYKGNPAVQKAQREMIYLAPDAVIVFDRVATGAGTTQTWQLPTPAQPSVSGNTATMNNGAHTLKVTKIQGGTLASKALSSEADFKAGYRLDETMNGGNNRFLHVLGIDNAVTNITPVGTNGVTVTLSNGKTVTATFHQDAIGGSLAVDGSVTVLEPGMISE